LGALKAHRSKRRPTSLPVDTGCKEAAMIRILGLMAALALAGVASAEWYTAYVNTFDSLDGVTSPEPGCEPYLYDGGAWVDCAIMYVMMDPVNGINIDPPIDFTYGDLTVTLQWYSEDWIPGEFVSFWLRLYSRGWDESGGEWVLSGIQNYFYVVEVSGPGGGPGWQTWTRPVGDYDETDFWGPFIDDQVYKFRIDAGPPPVAPYSFGISHFELVVPECPEDLDGDDDVDLSDLAVLLSNYGCTPTPPTPYYSTDGFEAYELGDLPGQDGWEDDTDPNTYGMVQVIDDPTGAGMGKVILLDPPGIANGTWQGAVRVIDPPPTERYVVIEWDQYRTGLGDNVWVADSLFFDGWWVIQWDGNGQASCLFFSFGVPLTAGQWQHVMYILDTVEHTATVDIDGERYTGPSEMPDTEINGIVFEVEPTEYGGEDGPMYIDNLVVGQGAFVLGCTREDGDYDGDGDVDLADLATLLSVYGCPTP